MQREADISKRMTRYELAGGWLILAGRTDADNEWLSLRHARPRDWWFHIKGQSGSHVLLRAPEGAEEATKEQLEQAASVAAWHSKARGAGLVAVNCTRAANVGKPRGSPVGTVSIRKEITIKARPAVPS